VLEQGLHGNATASQRQQSPAPKEAWFRRRFIVIALLVSRLVKADVYVTVEAVDTYPEPSCTHLDNNIANAFNFGYRIQSAAGGLGFNNDQRFSNSIVCCTFGDEESVSIAPPESDPRPAASLAVAMPAVKSTKIAHRYISHLLADRPRRAIGIGIDRTKSVRWRTHEVHSVRVSACIHRLRRGCRDNAADTTLNTIDWRRGSHRRRVDGTSRFNG
jgi:hypothetical protein